MPAEDTMREEAGLRSGAGREGLTCLTAPVFSRASSLGTVERTPAAVRDAYGGTAGSGFGWTFVLRRKKKMREKWLLRFGKDGEKERRLYVGAHVHTRHFAARCNSRNAGVADSKGPDCRLALPVCEIDGCRAGHQRSTCQHEQQKGGRHFHTATIDGASDPVNVKF
jgi:hypothetical protein